VKKKTPKKRAKKLDTRVVSVVGQFTRQRGYDYCVNSKGEILEIPHNKAKPGAKKKPARRCP
jgi:hypothetical protein